MIEGGLHGNIKGYREEPLQRDQPEDKKIYVMFIDSKRNQIKIHLKQKIQWTMSQWDTPSLLVLMGVHILL